MSKPGFVLLASCVVSCAMSVADAEPRRHLDAGDYFRLQSVDSPACSKDGQWVAYSVSKVDREADDVKSAVWIVNWAGTERWQLTADGGTASSPQFSPDGKYVSYLATRGGDEHAQLYVLDRRGGEPRILTHVVAEISDYRWSPDSSRVVLTVTPSDGQVEEAARSETSASKVPKPIVIGGFHFKEDRIGYVTGADRPRLYLLDVASAKLAPLTVDAGYAQEHPAWSPDGSQIAYVSNHEPDFERTGSAELYVVDAKSGSVARRIEKFFLPNKQTLFYTADGRQIAHTVGLEPRLTAYMHDRLALTPVSGGATTVVTDALDRAVTLPEPGPVSGTAAGLVEDDRSQYPALVRLASGRVERSVNGPMTATAQCVGGSHVAVIASTDTGPDELYAVDGGRLRPLSAHNDALMSELELGAVEDVTFKSADGTEVHGILVRPVGYEQGKAYPTILWIHGGPVGQDQHEASLDERQWFAAHGYLVLSVNYRGSSGRGATFQRSIVADWGHLEVQDLLAGIDYVVARGIADPARLGIGGWSYGGILTDYTIATDTRFKAAISGAGSGNQLSMFGADEYALQYVHELGEPWKNPESWLKVSYPFFHADRIRTPTLFMGGDKDFNVPISGGEQMYQALRTLGVPTELVVYPGQFHSFTRPSYIHDRQVRFLGWYDHYLKPKAD